MFFIMERRVGGSKKKDGAGVRGSQKLVPRRTVRTKYSAQDCDSVYAGVNDFDPRVHLHI
jgi:hypothetical protein